ncbi:hypothetical protein HanLR1_Chr16g0635721 [Helianthus annuus]|nr:hypothetical protein HanLR1_Chr16g0635721 [Helianthus annuus]
MAASKSILLSLSILLLIISTASSKQPQDLEEEEDLSFLEEAEHGDTESNHHGYDDHDFENYDDLDDFETGEGEYKDSESVLEAEIDESDVCDGGFLRDVVWALYGVEAEISGGVLRWRVMLVALWRCEAAGETRLVWWLTVVVACQVVEEFVGGGGLRCWWVFWCSGVEVRSGGSEMVLVGVRGGDEMVVVVGVQWLWL